MTTQTQKDQLATSAQASVDAAQAVKNAVDALAVDPDTNPLQAQLDAALVENAALRAKIDAARAAAQADKDADAANVAGQGVLDALA